jgi:hypothetical protein
MEMEISPAKRILFSPHTDADRHVQFVILTGVLQIRGFKLLIKIKPLFPCSNGFLNSSYKSNRTPWTSDLTALETPEYILNP